MLQVETNIYQLKNLNQFENKKNTMEIRKILRLILLIGKVRKENNISL